MSDLRHSDVRIYCSSSTVSPKSALNENQGNAADMLAVVYPLLYKSY